jgi:hypothetical protein
VTCNDYRRLALSLPESVESAHMNHPDFRVRGKIFATLWPDKGRGVVMLAPEQQDMVIAAEPGIFERASGAWGLRGSTMVTLADADEPTLRSALLMAWRNKAPKGLASP